MLEDTRPARIAIIGAGVTGLVTAYRLLQRGHEVTVFESGDQPGGSLRTFEVGGARLERFHQRLYTTDGAAIRLFDELGLLKSLKWRTTKVGILHGSRVYPFTSPWDLMRFRPLLGIRDRIRLGLVTLQLRRNQEGAGFDNVSASEWMRRHAGGRAANVIFDPLLQARFGEVSDQVLMAWLWNRLRLRMSSRTMLSRREMLGYQRGSFGVWTDTIVRLIGVLGGTVQTNARIARISRPADTLEAETEGDERRSFDAVVASVINREFLAIAPPLGEDYANRLRDLTFRTAVSLVLVLDRPLTDYYWISVVEAGAPFQTVVEHTNLAGTESYGGRHVVYVSAYVPADRGVSLSADELFASYLPYLALINPEFDAGWVVERHVFSNADAQPIFTIGAQSRIAPHQTPVPGLYLANMAQAYPQDDTHNSAIVLGEKIAALVANDLEVTPDKAAPP